MLFLSTGRAAAAEPKPPRMYEGMPNGAQNYAAFVELWDEFLYWRDPKRAAREQSLVDVAGLETDVYPDYGAAAIATRLRQLREFQDELDDFAVNEWPLAQQVEFLAVRAKLDEEEFTLRVSKPWSRDPGFYVDRMLRLTFTELRRRSAGRIRASTRRHSRTRGARQEKPRRGRGGLCRPRHLQSVQF